MGHYHTAFRAKAQTNAYQITGTSDNAGHAPAHRQLVISPRRNCREEQPPNP